MQRPEYFTTQLNGQQVMVATTGSIAFIWHGGCYIDVCKKSSMGDLILNQEHYLYGEECINVWNYSTRTTEIEWLNSEQFLNVIREWMSN